MPEETQTKRSEPEPIEAYRCPKCEKILVGTREEAQKHVDIPLDIKLPKGFVYKEGQIMFRIIESGGRLGERSQPHCYTYRTRGYNTKSPGIGSRGFEVGSLEQTLNIKRFMLFIQSSGQKGCSTLGEEEFNELRKKYQEHMERHYTLYSKNSEELIRTTPELEALLTEVQPVGEEELHRILVEM